MPIIEFTPRAAQLQHKVAILRERMRLMEQVRDQVKAQPDERVSLTDRDSRSMMSQAKGTGLVGYNVQTAVEANGAHRPQNDRQADPTHGLDGQSRGWRAFSHLLNVARRQSPDILLRGAAARQGNPPDK